MKSVIICSLLLVFGILMGCGATQTPRSLTTYDGPYYYHDDYYYDINFSM